MSLQTFSSSHSSSRYHNVDALRALAAFLVLWTHTADVFVTFAGNSARGAWLDQVAHEFDFGRMGVVAFFAISGFVIPMSLQGDRRGAALGQFAIGRFFRLYPAFWVSILPGALTFYWIWGKSFTFKEVMLNFTMIPTALGAQPAEGLYWTLQIELSFYLLCMVLHCIGWLHNSRRVLQVTFALLAGYLILRRSSWALDFAHLSIMFFGASCRQYVVSRKTAEPRSVLPLALYISFWVVFLPIYGWVIFISGQGTAHPHIGTFVMSYAFAMVLFVVALSMPHLKVSVMAWLGKISYSIYLLHPIVLFTMFWWIGQKGPAWTRELHLGVYILVCAAISVALAALSFYVVEKPSIRLGNRIKARFDRRRAPAQLISQGTI
jgi:peptidoglycan/LPS O-acetylase OafA/YrhL